MRYRAVKIRLTGKREFDAPFAGKRLATPELVFCFVPNGRGIARLGLVVGKKAVPGSVERNRLKRRVRDLFRRHMDAVKGFDLVVLARKGSGLHDYSVLERRFEKLSKVLKS